MKIKLIALLKTSFASKGFNAKELESLADLIISQQSLTDESADEDLTTAVTNAKPVADFVQSVASRQVSDVKKPVKVETTTTTETKEEVDPNETATDKALRLIMKKLEKTEQQLASFGQEKVATTRREQYAKTLEGTSDVFKAKALKDFDRMAFKDDEDFTSYLTDATEDAKAFIQDEANQGLGNDRPVGGVGGNNASTKKEATEAEVDAAFANLRI